MKGKYDTDHKWSLSLWNVPSRMAGWYCCARQTLFYFFAEVAIVRLKVQQRAAFADDDIFNFGDKYGVVAGILGALQAAFQIGERAVQRRRAVPRAVESRAR